jgi:hypothetical protein
LVARAHIEDAAGSRRVGEVGCEARASGILDGVAENSRDTGWKLSDLSVVKHNLSVMSSGGFRL